MSPRPTPNDHQHHHPRDPQTVWLAMMISFLFSFFSESSALEEVEDCTALTGVVAAIYGYKASGGDLVFLEKAYDLARGVAASKYDLTVAFNACRVALAVG